MNKSCTIAKLAEVDTVRTASFSLILHSVHVYLTKADAVKEDQGLKRNELRRQLLSVDCYLSSSSETCTRQDKVMKKWCVSAMHKQSKR